jgi:hypothetical protein
VHVKSSYKDPSGFLFWKDGELFRAIKVYYKNHYDFFVNSGLYKKLVDNKFLIQHEEVEKFPFSDSQIYKIIKPVKINFISYPFEWSFAQLKDAALLTLNILHLALEYGMTLKDASAYNIQFFQGKPVFIDTLSFEIIENNKPWIAYKQFCQHFIAPLALMAYKDVRLNQLLKTNLDGIPLDLANALLPLKGKMNFGILLNLVLHASAQKKFSTGKFEKRNINSNYSLNSLKGLFVNLEKTINSIKLKAEKTVWSNYYDEITANEYTKSKLNFVQQYIDFAKPKTLWDVGANDGLYSRLASDNNIDVVAFDFDHASIQKNYELNKKENRKNILPLVLDFSNPTSSLGWNLEEIKSFFERGNPDMVLALALVHHLAIAKNIPLDYIAQVFSKITSWLVVEFVPKSDPKVQFMLRNRKDIFEFYSIDNFEKEFEVYFTIKKKDAVQGSQRIIYLMRNKKVP